MSKSKPTRPDSGTTVKDLLDDLKAKGGHHPVWHEVKGMATASIQRKAIQSGKIELTEDGGVRLVTPKEKDIEDG